MLLTESFAIMDDMTCKFEAAAAHESLDENVTESRHRCEHTSGLGKCREFVVRKQD